MTQCGRSSSTKWGRSVSGMDTRVGSVLQRLTTTTASRCSRSMTMCTSTTDIGGTRGHSGFDIVIRVRVVLWQ